MMDSGIMNSMKLQYSSVPVHVNIGSNEEKIKKINNFQTYMLVEDA